MQNILSVDVEDYWSIFHRNWLCFEKCNPSKAVEKNTEVMLELFENNGVKGTFFILGEVAEKYNSLVKYIAKAGHEIASHGQLHKQVFKSNAKEFRKEVEHCKKYLEDLTGTEILGYRAPAFSINYNTKWALDILSEVGFAYDSSVSPMSGKRYGWPGFWKDIQILELESGRLIVEVPMSTVSYGLIQLGLGGGYLRHFPYIYTKLTIKKIQKSRPAIVYLHPYEIDLKDLPFKVSHLSRKKKKTVISIHRMQLRNRKTVKRKIESMLRDFKFTTISNVLSESMGKIQKNTLMT